MKNNRKSVLLGFLFTAAFAAQSAPFQGNHGRVSMQGAVIDSACAIAVESREQTIDMGRVPLSDIIRNGQGRSKDFAIKLINCVLERPGKINWQQFRIVFDGDADGALFGIHGQASGVGLQITAADGRVITPGELVPATDIVPGDMLLNYTLKLVANRHTLKSGDYFSAIRFRLDYF